jgi:hypothetical protein
VKTPSRFPVNTKPTAENSRAAFDTRPPSLTSSIPGKANFPRGFSGFDDRLYQTSANAFRLRVGGNRNRSDAADFIVPP